MKWNNRLKSVLTKNEKATFFGNCLETELRITAESQKSGVSAVIRSDEFRHLPKSQIKSDAIENQKNLVSPVIRSSVSRDSFKNNDELGDLKTEKFHEVLNGFIEAGITFNVSADFFLVMNHKNILSRSDEDFLIFNAVTVLCHLQQSALMKHLFSHSPEQFEDFAFEIRERESLLTITAKTPFEIYFEAVKQVTKKWFANLLAEKT